MRGIVGRGLASTGWGLVLGLIGGILVSRALAAFLFGVEPLDPATFGAVAVLILAVALVASYLPARRASRVDPVRALAAE